MKLQDADLLTMWLNSMTGTELKKAFPNYFETVESYRSNDENELIMLRNDVKLWKICKNYMQLLHMDLKREQVFPCDEEGNILNEPSMYKDYINEVFMSPEDNLLCIEYQQALKGVYFIIYHPRENIELLLQGENKVKYLIGKLDVELNRKGINYLMR